MIWMNKSYNICSRSIDSFEASVLSHSCEYSCSSAHNSRTWAHQLRAFSLVTIVATSLANVMQAYI